MVVFWILSLLVLAITGLVALLWSLARVLQALGDHTGSLPGFSPIDAPSPGYAGGPAQASACSTNAASWSGSRCPASQGSRMPFSAARTASPCAPRSKAMVGSPVARHSCTV